MPGAPAARDGSTPSERDASRASICIRVARLVAIAITLLVVMWLVVSWSIGRDVDRAIDSAIAAFLDSDGADGVIQGGGEVGAGGETGDEAGDDARTRDVTVVDALVAVVRDESQPLEARNRAVWALGQLGDPRALPALEALHDGVPCDHDERLCQRRLARVIDACRGALNVSAIVWRYGGRHRR